MLGGIYCNVVSRSPPEGPEGEILVVLGGVPPTTGVAMALAKADACCCAAWDRALLESVRVLNAEGREFPRPLWCEECRRSELDDDCGRERGGDFRNTAPAGLTGKGSGSEARRASGTPDIAEPSRCELWLADEANNDGGVKPVDICSSAIAEGVRLITCRRVRVSWLSRLYMVIASGYRYNLRLP